MSVNDNKIKEVLNQIELKKNQIGTRPRAAWKTNGLIGDRQVNINTINTLDDCLTLATEIVQKQMARTEAAKLIELGDERPINSMDEIDDLRLRVSMIKYDREKKKLNTLENQLKDLRSNDAKVEDAISDIISKL